MVRLVTSAILTIGTELTRGELHDKNGGDLARKLTDLGYEVTEISSVDDDDNRIVAALQRLATRHAFVVCTGGLGPTTDDRTSACAARALGVPLARHPDAYEQLRNLMESRGRTLTPASEKQADFPEGARVLLNPRGSAPGFSVRIGHCSFFFMPGVPTEMERMFDVEVVPLLPPPEKSSCYKRLRTFGLPEVEVNDLLAGVEETYDVVIGYRASNSEIEVKILAEGRPGEPISELEARASRATTEVKERLGDAVYSEGTTPLSAAVGELLLAQNKTLGLAESCTGGLVSQMITSVPGSSAYYFGGVVSYDNSVKRSILGVPEEDLEQHGAVSEPVVRAMAEGARRALGVDIALSLSGIAGPGGGSIEKPVGLVHFAVSSAKETRTFRYQFRGTRQQIQRRAALFGLWQVRALLLENSTPT